jgi:hypothetical protein
VQLIVRDVEPVDLNAPMPTRTARPSARVTGALAIAFIVVVGVALRTGTLQPIGPPALVERGPADHGEPVVRLPTADALAAALNEILAVGPATWLATASQRGRGPSDGSTLK